jgi:hypothetical protein
MGGLLALGLLPLVLGEVWVRWLMATRELPVAEAHHRDLELTWTLYERRGRTDILILGDSLARMGVHPGTLADLATERSGRPVSVHNLATPGSDFEIYESLIERLASEGRLPGLVIVVLSGDHLERRGPYRRAYLPSQMGQLFSGCQDRRQMEELLSCQLSSRLALWRWRGRPQRLAESTLSALSWRPLSEARPLRSDGFRSAPPITSLEKLQAQLPRALERTATRLSSNRAAPGFRALVQSLRARGASVVAVTIPYSPLLQEALEERAPGWRLSRSEAFRELGQIAGLEIIDIDGFGPSWRLSDARDVKHLSHVGAIRFTRQLWSDERFRAGVVAGLGEGG